MSILEGLSNVGSPAKWTIGVIVVTAAIITKFLYSKREPALNPKEYKKFKLSEKKIINHNTRLFRFDLPHPRDVLGLPIGQHLSVKATSDGKEVYRSYTPVSSDDDLGHFDLIIKVYDKGVMSKYIDGLAIGDHLEVRGPKGLFLYRPGMVRAIGMLAGGTGITPMLQIVRAILKDPKDKTQVNLIFANVNEDDILLRTELDSLASKHSNFSIYYVLNNPPSGWTGGVGFVSKDMIQNHLPPSADDIKIVMCGPPMMNKAMQSHLESLNYPAEQFFIF